MKFPLPSNALSVLLILLLVASTLPSNAQTVPRSLRSNIKISALVNVDREAVRLAKDPISGNLFYCTVNGSVYEVVNNSGTYTSTLRYTSSTIGIAFLQGMAFHGNTLFLIGNNRVNSYDFIGKVVKGVRQANGSRIWSTVLTTQVYGLTNTAFDHGFSGITISPDGNSIFISSGSRSDHGEIQSNGGTTPGLRDQPLTSAIFKIPIGTVNLTLVNDSTSLANSGYLYADGTRNTFDLAFAPNGHLFGAENSGDRDDPEELNWIRQGRHYGFPWLMGGNETPMQFAGYVPANDKLVNPNYIASQNGYFYNDPSYPKKPSINFHSPVQNLGPDADKFRDPATGQIKDASDLGISMSTFTTHKSPLGLVFDKDNALIDQFKGDGFILGWTIETSDPVAGVGPFYEGQDLMHLNLIYDAAIDNYKVETYRIADGFNNPIDCEMVGNIIYVIEYGGTSPKIWKVEMPTPSSSYPVGSDGAITFQKWDGITGTQISALTGNANFPNTPTSTGNLTSFEATSNIGDNYGLRILGSLTAPETGTYRFWIAGDDNVELWLSTTNSSTNKVKIAYQSEWTNSREWNKYSTQKSVAISLVAGSKYYVEALLKEGSGGDNVAVGWRKPSDGSGSNPAEVVPGSVLNKYIPETNSANNRITYQKWNVISGNTVASLTGNANFPNSPTSSTTLTSFEAASWQGDNYGARIVGYITAPESGNYYFWVAGDDQVELWLSTTNSASNKVKIAFNTNWTNSREWNKYGTQKSASISLTAGSKYYVEALMKEGTGGDNLAVGWRKPSNGNGTSPIEVIPGSVLSTSLSGLRILEEEQEDLPKNNIESVLVYPNPSRHFLNVEANEEIKSIQMFNATGKNVMTVENINSNKIQFNIQHLQRGVFFMNVEVNSGKRKTRKVFLQ